MKVPMWAVFVVCATQPMLAQLQLSALDGLASKAKESAEIGRAHV